MTRIWQLLGILFLVLAAVPLLAQFVPFGFWKKASTGGSGGSGLYGTALAGYQYTCFDGDILALEKPASDRIVAGGNFTIAAPCTGKGVPIGISSGNVVAGWSYPSNRVAGGDVYASVSDGAGGWYVGGNFRSVGGVARPGLARLTSTGQLDLTFNPSVTATKITAIEKIGSRVFVGGFSGQDTYDYGTPISVGGDFLTSLEVIEAGPLEDVLRVAIPDGGTGWYIGGFFTSIQGEPISGIARVDANGKVDPTFNLAVNGSVYALKLIGNTLYFGGFFTSAGGVQRYNLASVSTVTGLLTSWYPGVIGGVYTIEEDGAGNLLIGGGVKSVGGLNLGSHISRFDVTTGGILDFPAFGVASSFPGVYSAEPDGSGGYYIGGRFTQVGTFAVNNLAHIQSDGTVNPNFRPNVQFGGVNKVLRHGGTIFIGGNFTDVNSAGCFGFCGLNAANGAVLATPRANTIDVPSVNDLAISGGTIFIGGFFAGINGTARSNIAAMSMTSNTPLAWNPGANGAVNALIYTQGTLFVGGGFGTLGGSARGRIGALNPATGAVHAFDPSADGTVVALALTGGTLFAGGTFTNVGGQARNNLAALNTTAGTAFLSFNPNVNGLVYELGLIGDQLFVGGSFTAVGGVDRYRLASISSSAGTLNHLNLSFDDTVRAIATSGTTFVIGGGFLSTQGSIRNNVLSVNQTTGAVQAWNPNADNDVEAIKVNGTVAYLAGDFLNVGGQSRRCLAATDLTTGAVNSWNPGITGGCALRDFEIDGGNIFVAGYFGTIGGLSRYALAQVDLSTGAPTTWNASVVGSSIETIKILGGNLYLGGLFSTVGGQPRTNAASVNLGDGSLNSWNPGPSSYVHSIASNGTGLYLAGDFTFFSGSSTKLLALNSVTGAAEYFPAAGVNTVGALKASGATLFVGTNSSLLSLDSSSGATLGSVAVSGSPINDILVTSGSVFIGGNFFFVGGQTRDYLAAVVRSAGTTAAWAPTVDNQVRTLGLGTNTLLIGGDFLNAGGSARNRIAELNLSTGAATAWNPNANNRVWSLFPNGSTVHVGGDFTSIGGSAQRYLAEVQLSNGSLTAWNPMVTGGIFKIASDGTNFYLGGTLSGANGITRNRIAALSTDTGQLTDWNPNANGTVSAFATLGVDLLVGGSFGTIGGAARSRLAILNGSTGGATAWTANVTGGTLNGAQVRALLVNGTLAYVAGTYGTIASVVRANLAAVSIATGTVTAMTLASNGTAFKSLAYNQGTLWIGGTYGTIGGQVRRGLSAITVAGAGAVVGTFNPAVDTSNIDYRALLYSNGTIYVGGKYFDISTSTGSTRPKIANVNATTGSLGTLADTDFVIDTVNALGLGNNNLYVLSTRSASSLQAKAYSTSNFVRNSWMLANGNTNNLFSLLVDGSNVYVGGESHRSDDLPRFQLNRVDGVTGNSNW